MPSRAEIASTVQSAFNSAGDVIRDGTLTRSTPTYNEEIGSATSTTSTSACKVLFDRASRTMSLFLSAQVVKPTDQPAWLAMSSFAPAEADKLTVDGTDYTVVFAEDVVKAGALHFIVLR